jgi:nucleotide-binding universal stress UspA family protein
LESWLHVVATTLLVVGIPLILFAGFCLDWAEAKPQGPQSDRTSNKHGVLRLVPIVAVMVLLGGTQQAEGQQTIFNVPTTDVLDKGKVYLELDASLKPIDGAVVPKFSSFVPRVVVGTGNEVEVGLNITGNVQPGPDSTTLVPTVKWKPFSNENNGWALVVGDHVFIPVRNRSYHIQHLESLNDVVSRTTAVRVRETIPDHFLARADEVVNVDVSVDTLRTRLRQGKIYDVVKIEQALNNFFRKGNLSTLRELALRQVAIDQAAKAHDYREREGLEHAVIPEKVMVAIASRGSAKKLLRIGSRIAGRLASDWYAVYVEIPNEEPGRIKPRDYSALQENIRFAEELGAKVVKLKAAKVADALIEFAQREGFTHVVFGQTSRSRWDIVLHGSIINRFLDEVRDATVQVVPLDKHIDLDAERD